MKKRFVAILLLCCILLGSFEGIGASTVSAKSKIKLNKTKKTLQVGQTCQLKVKGTKKKVTWKSSKKSVATVSSKGKVKAKKSGVSTITAKVAKKKLKCKITVKNPSINSTEIVATTEDKTTEARTELQEKQGVDVQYTETAVTLFKKSSKDALAQKKNVMISPYSILSALAMTANGAAGNTQKEMESALCGTYGIEDMNAFLANRYTEMCNSAARQGTKFNSANSIWLNKELGVTLNKEFQQKNESLFNAQCFERTFNDETKNEVNAWVKNNTNQMIPEIINILTPDSAMLLINAIAFEARWRDEYYSHSVKDDEFFTKGNGQKEQATMMYETQEGNYIEDAHATGFSKSYEGGYAFVALLPEEGMAVEDYLATLTGKHFLELYANRKMSSQDVKYRVYTKLPKFGFEYESKSMKPTLQEMGIKDAFVDSVADFSKMGTVKIGNGFFIDDVLHKTCIEVDEKGTKASAATVIIMKPATSGPPKPQQIIEKKVYLERPFIYAIVEEKTGLPLFIGVVNSVNK